MTPSEVNSENEDAVRARMFPPKAKKFKWKYQVGDNVRISIARRVFRKGYVGNWSEEIFTIVARHPTQPVTYSLHNAADEAVKGRFYEPEIAKVLKPADDYYVVEKILRKRRRGGKLQYYVKWRGYPETFNSWTDAVRPLKR